MMMMMMGKGGGMWGAGAQNWGAGASAGGAKAAASSSADWGPSKSKKTPGQLPEIKSISLEGSSSSLLMEGYGADAPALEFWKECAIFSEANDILQSFFGEDDWRDSVTMEHDPDTTMYPEVYEAWKAGGGEENSPTIAKCASLGKWAVGFGGKKNAERAAKLSMALSIAADADPAKLGDICGHYPDFASMCEQCGIAIPPPGKKTRFK